MTNRAVVIVCDSLGVGELPDAADFGDEGSNTLGHVLDSQHPTLPALTRLGLLHTLPTPATTDNPSAAYGRMAEVSAGKDTTTGHWEMMGLIVEDPFRTYPNGFPADVIAEYERRIGRKTLGNKAASGTVILDELGEEHMRTGAPIVYTSADSVFQVAAHEEIIPVEELWRICAIARELMRGEHNIGRIIAAVPRNRQGALQAHRQSEGLLREADRTHGRRARLQLRPAGHRPRQDRRHL